jgi:hypothetical protein
LETKIDTNLTPESVFSDRGTLFSFANAFYASMPYGFTALDGNLFAPASDEAQQTNVGFGNVRPFNQGTLSPVNIPNDVSAQYRSLYDGIRAANFFLKYSQGFYDFLIRNRDTTSGSALVAVRQDSLNISWYRAEAHVARAFYYSELIKRYGGVPIITETYTDASELSMPRSSYEQVVDYIISEIDTYKDSLQVNWKTSSFKGNDGRFSKASALAIKSRVLLYAASPLNNPTNDVTKWQKAALATKDLMTTPGLTLSLYGGGYGNLFLGNTPIVSSNNEVILAVRRPASNFPESSNYPIATPGGNSGITPSHNLVAEYEYIGVPNATNPYANRDPRLAATVVTNGSSWNSRVIDQSPGGTDDMSRANSSKTGYYLKKFLTDNLNLVQGATAQHNWILFRYAEILLNYAEAMNEAYGPDVLPSGYTLTARQALKMVRDRASTMLPLVTATSVPDFRNAIKRERRIELAFEDFRYWDLLRWNDAQTVLNQPLRGVRVTKNGSNQFVYQEVTIAPRAFNAPAMYRFPFSLSEIVNSKNKIVQNPNY